MEGTDFRIVMEDPVAPRLYDLVHGPGYRDTDVLGKVNAAIIEFAESCNGVSEVTFFLQAYLMGAARCG